MKLVPLLFAAIFGLALGCDDDPTSVVVDNDYLPPPDGGNGGTPLTPEMTVYKAWWGTSLLPDPVAPGAEGQIERTVPYSDYAYAVLAPGWNPTSSTAPTTFVAVRSATQLTATRGGTLHIHVSDATFIGNCSANEPLTEDEAVFITTRVFPAEFTASGLAYDAAHCAMQPGPTDSGIDWDSASDASVE